MPLKYPTPLTRHLFRGSRWLRATSSLPSDPSSGPENRVEHRIRWAHRENDDPEPEPQPPQIRHWGARAWAATQTPMTVAESRKTHAGTLRVAHGLTVCIHNVPPQASIGEVLDIVLAGPIFDVKDSVQNGSRTVSVTFFHRDGAHNFYSDVKSREINLYGYRPEFSWARGESPRWSPGLGRSIVIWDKGQLGTEEDILRYLSLYGPMERITLMKERIADRAFVNFLNAESGAWAAEELRRAGARVGFVNDRCLVARLARDIALKFRSRTVILRGIPPETSLSELCDNIRGGAIHRINFVPKSGVAFVHFVEHSSAAYFLQYAIYEGIIIGNKRLEALFWTRSEHVPTFITQNVESGATRCLGIEGIVNPDMLWMDCLRYGNVERVAFSGQMSIVAFTHIQHAIKAFRMLPSKISYEGLKITFIADPCAAPFPKHMERAAALQAEVSSMLTPRRVQESPTDDPRLPPNRAEIDMGPQRDHGDGVGHQSTVHSNSTGATNEQPASTAHSGVGMPASTKPPLACPF